MPQIFMETGFEKKKEVANILGITEWLCFTCCFGNGESDFRRIEIYSGRTEVRSNKKWVSDVFGTINNTSTKWVDSIYGND